VDVVIKVGGSLSETPRALKALGAGLCCLARQYRIMVVPGGGKFADAVRDLDAKFTLSAALAHRMAILAMDEYGLLLSQVIPECSICDLLGDAQQVSDQRKVPVFLPSKLLFQENPFEPSWDITSDSIAAYIAVKSRSAKAIFVTDVDGIFTKDPRKHADAKLMPNVSIRELAVRSERTSVDKYLPRFLMENQLDCYVVNGKYPQRIGAVLSDQQTVCTRIFRP
jgi:5-(aminomethyl)-3-furanmethanol phosphate kinase